MEELQDRTPLLKQVAPQNYIAIQNHRVTDIIPYNLMNLWHKQCWGCTDQSLPENKQKALEL